MSTSTLNSGKSNDNSNVVDIFSRKTFTSLKNERFIRLSPEYDGLSMLYSTCKTTQEKLFTMKILCWAIRDNGEVVALVPWLNKILPCNKLDDPFYGQFEGYYDLTSESVFYNPPLHKVTELQTTVGYYDYSNEDPDTILQEIPDTIGTHAMLNTNDAHSLILTEVLSWRLLNDGRIQAMLIDESMVAVTPVLPGDPCLYPAEENPDFRYFFQHQIANQIKSKDPDAIAAIALLFENSLFE
ncbi:MAG: hypothetical protein V3T17_05605 [Pseudomonadales bacterium]